MTSLQERSAPRYRYVGDAGTPKVGTLGTAAPAAGHDNPESCAYGAYLFKPDGEEYVYYVDPQVDLERLP